MSDPLDSQSVLTLLSAIRTQTDVITTWSSGGLGVVILTWGRILGILPDANLSGFRIPVFLVFPSMLLLLSVILGYFIGAQITGYLTEIALGKDSSSGEVIRNFRTYYFASYEPKFHWMMFIQLCFSVIGITAMSGWFAWNILQMKGKPKCDTPN